MRSQREREFSDDVITGFIGLIKTLDSEGFRDKHRSPAHRSSETLMNTNRIPAVHLTIRESADAVAAPGEGNLFSRASSDADPFLFLRPEMDNCEHFPRRDWRASKTQFELAVCSVEPETPALAAS